MATIIKCDICGAEGAKHFRTIVYKPFTTDVKYKELRINYKNITWKFII